MKEKMKEVVAGVDSVLESYAPEDTELTKEVRRVHITVCHQMSIQNFHLLSQLFRAVWDCKPLVLMVKIIRKCSCIQSTAQFLQLRCKPLQVYVVMCSGKEQSSGCHMRLSSYCSIPMSTVYMQLIRSCTSCCKERQFFIYAHSLTLVWVLWTKHNAGQFKIETDFQIPIGSAICSAGIQALMSQPCSVICWFLYRRLTDNML